ncbi:hypothetical protein CARUB_v10001343mg [Capsella rubella]|uniref:Fungal lipase-type domain-containing protein n=1 Tax=Capsella rubella TaxID=81985 RepID=R0HBI5_9BRAS|nr:GDSL esterase/lipase At4g10955 [Capsella rubella]EOA21008.1 hypothetical protein CARUB_v10001343mg [Capsella rubella]
MGILDSSRSDALSRNGPPRIPYFDWNNFHHRTSLMSCLVLGVYAMERDRQDNRIGSESLAPPWWESFNFTLIHKFTDRTDVSIYGAVFQNMINYEITPNSIVPPRYVIALRGTVLSVFAVNDLMQNSRLPFEILQKGDKSMHIVEEIQSFVSKIGNTTVWIVGHSLGAALALLAGKTMAKSGLFLEAYIFNPPISLIPLEHLGFNDTLNFTYRFTRDIFKAGMAKVLSFDEDQEGQQLKNLASWKPYLFVNQSDPISSEYIGNSKHIFKMTKVGLGKIASLAAAYSVRRKCSSFGREEPSDHLHFLPSVIMWINKTAVSSDIHESHGIHQWWNPMLQLFPVNE